MTSPDRIPVIIGVGQINDRPADPAAGLDPLDLMEAALREAEADAGGGWLSRLDWLGTVKQIGFPDLHDPAPALGARLGAAPRTATTSSYPGGNTPIAMLHTAAKAIARGEVGVAAIVGGEALRTAAARKIADPMRGVAVHGRDTLAYRYGLLAPVDVYPLYENATRAAWSQTLTQAQAETGEIWALMSRVAAANPAAWLRAPRTPAEITSPSPANRPIAHPYLKLMVANSAVNQAAGFLVTTLATARQAGIPEHRLIYVGGGAAADEPADYLRRDRYDRSASMVASINGALAANRLTAADLDAVELYSCFPCVPKMARRILGWPAGRPATLVGGLTFGGGPIGNYMSHAVAAATLSLREQGRNVLLFANGGYATYNHTILLTREPPAAGAVLQPASRQTEADAARDPAPPLLGRYEGPGTIETYTVLYNRDATPRVGVVVARTSAGERFLAHVPATDSAAIAFLTDGKAEPVGSTGHATAGEHNIWHLA